MNKNAHATSLEAEKAAIENCENENIHNIELIQPFGFLLACNPREGEITHASVNCPQLFSK